MLGWLGAASLVTMVVSALMLPFVIVRMPEHYFLDAGTEDVPEPGPSAHPVWVALRRALGIVFLIAGVLMLVLPGQGLLTIFMGLMLLQGPRTKRWERKLVVKGRLLEPMNWIRRRAGKMPLRAPRP